MQHPPIASPENSPSSLAPMYSRSRRVMSALMLSSVLISGAAACANGPETATADVSTVAATYDPVSLREYEPTPDCVDPPTSAEKWQKMFGNIDGWLAGDDIVSGPELPGNRKIFFTGDHLATANNVGNQGDKKFVHNGLVTVCGDDAKLTNPGVEAIPNPSPTEWYWPNATVVIKDNMYVYADRVTSSDEAPGFKLTGTDIAVFSMPKEADGLPMHETTLRLDTKPNSKVAWGKSAVASEDGYIYEYGTHTSGEDLDFGRDVYVSRIKSTDLENHKLVHEYWNGRDWVNSQKEAKAIIRSPRMAGLDQSWVTQTIEKNGEEQILFIAKKDGQFGTEIGQWTSDSPQGKFAYHRLVKLPKPEDNGLTYLANPLNLGVKGSKTVLVALSNNKDQSHLTPKEAIIEMAEKPQDFTPTVMEVTRK